MALSALRMVPRKLFLLAGIGAVVGAVGAVRILEARVDRLAMALGIGIAAGPATPEAEQLFAAWSWLLEISDVSAAVVFLLVILGGVPLAVVAAVAKFWPRSVSRLQQYRNALRVCLTWQLMNVGFPVLLIVFFPSLDGLSEVTAAVVLVSVVYLAVNLWAARVWRELLQPMNASGVATVKPAV